MQTQSHIAPANLAAAVRAHAQTTPDKIALVWQNESVTWADLDAR